MNRRNFLKGITASIASLVALKQLPDVAAQEPEVVDEYVEYIAYDPHPRQLVQFAGDIWDDRIINYIHASHPPQYTMYGNRETKRVYDAIMKEYFENAPKPKIRVVPRG